MYQRVMKQALEGCEGVRNIHDDIIVHEKTTEQHDTRLEKPLGRIQEKRLTLNKEKCNFHMSEIEFMEHLLSARGIGPIQAKVGAVKSHPLGVTIAVIPFYSETHPIHQIMRETEEYVRFVDENATSCALSTGEIESASANDKELCNVWECIQIRRWETLKNKRYLMVRSELSVIGKLVLRSTRIIVPSSSREKVLNLAHDGHPDIVLMERRLRTNVWWPNCEKDSKRFCKSCLS